MSIKLSCYFCRLRNVVSFFIESSVPSKQKRNLRNKISLLSVCLWRTSPTRACPVGLLALCNPVHCKVDWEGTWEPSVKKLRSQTLPFPNFCRTLGWKKTTRRFALFPEQRNKNIKDFNATNGNRNHNTYLWPYTTTGAIGYLLIYSSVTECLTDNE